MTAANSGPRCSSSLFGGFSLEMTANDVESLREAATTIPQGTLINITHLGTETDALRTEAVQGIQRLGLVPVSHIAARRVQSEGQLKEFLGALQDLGASERLFVVSGDPTRAEGPFDDAESIIGSGLLPQFGVRSVGISGYPAGHPHFDEQVLWGAVGSKLEALDDQGLQATIITQFGFDVAPVLQWLQHARERGVTCPVRVGVPGPAGIRRLLTYARRFGVHSSAGIVQKYGFSLTNLLGSAGPGQFIQDLEDGRSASIHGEVQLHFYTFGGLRATAQWLDNTRHSRETRR